MKVRSAPSMRKRLPEDVEDTANEVAAVERVGLAAALGQGCAEEGTAEQKQRHRQGRVRRGA